ncbi:hypothetical protein DM860_008251 [Cuscuta australis]|uniref:Uncharacterized protein n=1 Tax=Cuscuta australis TaxID=267555 RepID=A0A328D716_9ASTE|nr:hypothetical protein DM860_008251 [Cuscuta australis]
MEEEEEEEECIIHHDYNVQRPLKSVQTMDGGQEQHAADTGARKDGRRVGVALKECAWGGGGRVKEEGKKEERRRRR